MMKKNSNKKILGKICAIVFGIAFVFCTPDSVYADESVTYLDESGEETTCNSCTKIPEDGSISSLESGFYYVESDVTIHDRITINGDSKLILCNGATLKAEKGIQVGRGKLLYIYAQSKDGSMGKLEATGSDNVAGIGGDENGECGTVAIYGGTVTATGGANGGAGIGGGSGKGGGYITINGGNIKAFGGNGAAGIGGGLQGAAGEIVINGGQVEATAQNTTGASGAGIGSGAGGDSTGFIIINNEPQIKAIGGANGAGIGGGKNAGNAQITINGGKIEAIGGNGAAGIGGGMGPPSSGSKNQKEIAISGGTVIATGGTNGAGIGGGYNCEVKKIIISNGDVTATGGNQAAGIGGGSGKGGGTIEIIGGKIAATGGANGGAGIGGGKNGDGGDITIKDGEVTVKGNGGGAGIGGGNDGAPGTYTHSGGRVIDKDKPVPPGGKKDSSDDSSDEPKNDSNRDDSNHSSIILMQNFKGEAIGGLCTFEKQGALCAATFKAATPAGFTEAFSFNLNLDSTGRTKVNYDKKQGKIVLNIPTQYQKQGRTFAVIGIDRFGKTKIFYDNDADDTIFTTNLDIEGYAFSLIYSDKTTTVSNNDTYVVKQGDCLSKIAETVKKSVKYLAEKNGLENPDKIYVDQILKY